jgi:hypothetical protein
MSAMSIFKLRLARLVAPYPTDETTAPQRRGMTMLGGTISSRLSAALLRRFRGPFPTALGATSSVVGARASIVSAVGFLAPLLVHGWWSAPSSASSGRCWAAAVWGARSLLLMALVPFISQGQSAWLHWWFLRRFNRS